MTLEELCDRYGLNEEEREQAKFYLFAIRLKKLFNSMWPIKEQPS